MAFQVSPGVEVNEVDLTNIIPAVSTTRTGFAGFFDWGPLEQRININSVNQLRTLFGDPNDNNANFWFSTANFLGYGSNLDVVRVVNQSTAKNSGDSAGFLIKNTDDYNGKATGTYGDNVFLGKFPGGEQGILSLGNSLLVTLSDTTHRSVTCDAISAGNTFAIIGSQAAVPANGTTLGNIGRGDSLVVNGVSRQIDTVSTPVGGETLQVNFSTAFTNVEAGATDAVLQWGYADNFSRRLPATSQDALDKTGQTAANDLVHIAVIDKNGFWTGTRNQIIETFDSVSKGSNIKTETNANNFYKDVIRDTSNYIYAGKDFDKNVSGDGRGYGTTAADDIVFQSTTKNAYLGLTGGIAAAPTDFFENGYELFEDSETTDVSILIGGPSEGTLSKNLISLCENRKDCIVFLSPPRDAVLNTTSGPKQSYVQTANVRAYRKGVNGSSEGGDVDYTSNNVNVSSSYGVLDSGWKYTFDRFNDTFRYVPLNADIAGIAVRADFDSEPWFSPAGLNRGQVQNAVNLAFNPVKSERDTLYQEGINPVISFPGQGTVLFGDKTLLAKPSAFDRINVRRLFIVLEKAISTAAQFSLFELNDRFTRAQFKNLIEPFLLDVQARRGITDFRVVCDETNNTSEIIDRNEFVADIFVQPTRSINFITLNFVATRTGVNFDEIAGVV